MKIIALFLILLINEIALKEKIKNEVKRVHFCGANYLSSNIQKSKTSKIVHSNSKTRKLKTDYTPIRIFVDTTYLNIQVKNIQNMEDKLPIIKYALDKSVNGMSKLLEVQQFQDNVYSGLNADLLNYYKIDNWDEKLNDPEKISLDYDYVLMVRFQVQEDNFPEGVLAAAMPILLEEKTKRPIVGLLMITCFSKFFEKENVDNYFSNVFIHELTHGFGFLRSAFPYFPGGEEKTLFKGYDSNNIERYYIKTPKVVEFAKKYYGCNDIQGVEVENQGTGGSAGSHWEGRILLGEYMTAENYEDEVVISEFTLALLEDSGWFKANYYTGGLMRFGKNKGCQFLNSHCIFYDSNYMNYYTYFNDEYFAFDMAWFPSCTTGRQSRAYNLLMDYPDVEEQFRYLVPYVPDTQKYKGGLLYSSDYCPVNFHLYDEYKKSYFVGNCKRGNGDYGSNLYYINSTGQRESNHTNSELPKELGEKYSDNSFCMMSSLVPNGDSSMYGTIYHPMCFPSYCSSQSLTILIYDQYIVCPRGGGNVEVDGYKGKVHCPDYNLICTGTVVCNDLFDCIDKKSETKSNTFTYDYTKSSTQRYISIEQGQTFIGYELGDDGVCPKNCVQCVENKQCKICRKGFNLKNNQCEKEDDNSNSSLAIVITIIIVIVIGLCAIIIFFYCRKKRISSETIEKI